MLKQEGQYQALRNFFAQLRTPAGQPVGINEYANPEAFRKLLTAALEGWARRELEVVEQRIGAPGTERSKNSSTLQSAGLTEMFAQLETVVRNIKQQMANSNRYDELVRGALPAEEPRLPDATYTQSSRPAALKIESPGRGESGASEKRRESTTLPHEEPKTAEPPPKFSLLWSWAIKSVDPATALRRSLLDFVHSERESLSAPDEISVGLDAWAPSDVDFLIAGHTRSPSSIPRSSGPGHYFNAGGWAARLSLPTTALSDDIAFLPLFHALTSAGQLDELVNTAFLDPFSGPRHVIFEQPYVVSVVKESGRVFGRLQFVDSTGALVPTTDPVVVPESGAAHDKQYALGTLLDFDEVHVVSDLHLTASVGLSIFREGYRLIALIENLMKAPSRRIALVLNGNTFDLRSECSGRYIDPEGATKYLHRMMLAVQNAPVFEALKRFVLGSNNYLAFVLGDREVEVALPHVREWLVGMLSGNDPATRERVLTAFDGVGLHCTIMGRRVLCVHGHEVDPWNVVDHEQLFRLTTAMKMGRAVPEWEPSAGTTLLVDVLNSVRRRYPFVGTMRPVNQGLVGVLLVLDPSMIKPLSATVGSLARKRFGKATKRRAWDFL